MLLRRQTLRTRSPAHLAPYRFVRHRPLIARRHPLRRQAGASGGGGGGWRSRGTGTQARFRAVMDELASDSWPPRPAKSGEPGHKIVTVATRARFIFGLYESRATAVFGVQAGERARHRNSAEEGASTYVELDWWSYTIHGGESRSAAPASPPASARPSRGGFRVLAIRRPQRNAPVAIEYEGGRKLAVDAGMAHPRARKGSSGSTVLPARRTDESPNSP
jgi:hypothetical protein